jgi:hypothetical protein
LRPAPSALFQLDLLLFSLPCALAVYRPFTFQL